ncbi:ras guanine nucleotide exchange factor domain-containing protein [Naematelia encephala]|uniref:Ras guanine nucleotide exchange factor domain-containing protein n=1 Tax=Naematelia encephala TaxID=71784 RepID=A0A1Y2BFU8_9TREE|nr:ras guanine nucleotide exchange factor domain-containing protein [Naematelia encephala]
MIQTNIEAGPSWSNHSHSTDNDAPPTPVSPSRMPTHVQAIHEFDPSLLASTSASSQNMYLSFKSGEIIRVHVRDASGWWDGEISVTVEERVVNGPRRGWFPSNYVREMGWDTNSHKKGQASIASTSISSTSPKSRKDSINHSRHASTTSRASTSTSTSHALRSSGGGSHAPAMARGASSLPSSLQALLHPIVQALSLLESAIHANRKTHLQPATACVISCIRAALEQTDCISKESPTLVNHPVLAKERKIVLLELSKLVSCTRTASGVHDGTEAEVDDAKALEVLAKAARGVFASAKRFLVLAGECGVEATAPKSNAETQEEPSDSLAMRRTSSRTSVGSNRMQEAFRLKAASISDLRAARRRQASPPPPLPVSAGIITKTSQSRTRSPSRVITPLSATFASSSGSGRSSPVSQKSSHNRRVIGSMDSSFSHASTPSSDAGYPPWEDTTPVLTPIANEPNRQLGSVADVHEAVGLAEDTLLSIIAAFIGHLHSYHINSHPSSHAYLIEMTRETIDAVRDVLTIVETVGRNAGIRLSRPREIEHLRVAKDLLYDIASRLVEGAEVVANAPFSEGGEEGYDQEKGRLLQMATGTLRAGTECVRLVKQCLPEDEATLLPAQLATPRQNDGQHNRQLTPRPADAAVILRDKVVGVRGEHTLSGLHRKASSLSHLQQRYQNDGGMVQAPQEEDEGDDEEDDEEVVQDSGREDDDTLRPVIPTTVTFPPTPVRPVLQKTHTTPALGTVDAPELLRSYSDASEPITRSRSSSLSSPAPPKVSHRSPSRSADLDKFTSDYPEISNRSSVYSSTLSATTTGTSARSSEMSEFTTLTPQTTHGEEDLLSLPAQSSLAKMGHLSIDTDLTPTQPQTLPRPSMSRAVTAPAPQADVRFWVVAHDYDPREISFNSEGNMIGASLTVLVEKMTPHDGPVDPTFSATFFFTFRLFTTPQNLAQAVMVRYDLQPPQSVALGERERAIWVERKVVPVRLRIYNFLKSWLDSHWQADTDDVVLESLLDFAANVVMRTLPAMAPRLIDAIRKRQSGPWSAASSDASHKRSSSSDKFRLLSPMAPVNGLPPTPVISKSLHSLLQKSPATTAVAITDFDTLELARQMTIMESKLFAAVIPEEMLRTGKKTIPELKALSNLSNQITGWVADGILNEQDAKRRASLLKFYIKLADKCLTLNNFSTMFAVLAGLNTSIVLRLKKTWDALSPKYRLLMDRLRGVIEHTKNHAAYRARLREVHGPCLPFLGLILTDITFTSDGNPDTRAAVLAPEMQLINFDKYVKLGRIAIEFRRYQQPFNFHELEAVQIFLKRVLAERGSASLDALYRKSREWCFIYQRNKKGNTDSIKCSVARATSGSRKDWH